MENKILSLMQQHEDHLHNELKELEKKYTSQLSDYEERLMLQTQKHENELRLSCLTSDHKRREIYFCITGDGADNTNDETQTTPDQTANNYSLSRSGSETNSLIDADSYKTPPQVSCSS
ncbi:unnamed protein product [Trichobilharzia regenti]|nr:unnamed protein product [Trichobilharzia regenti]